jgi:LysR family transcriptional regulator of gallate degradation
LIPRNLRHLRLLLAVAETRSLKLAAERTHVSQPAVTQAIGKLERESGGPLFDRTQQRFFATPRCKVLSSRVQRAFDLLDPALSDVSPRLKLTATTAQLQALVAVHETENFTLAARRLGLAQPTVHRAISRLETESGRSLFERTSFGMIASKGTKALVEAVMLAFREIDQAEEELAELDGGHGGRIVIGALPLSRSFLLPQAIVSFRQQRPRHPLLVVDGRYEELLRGLRRGEIDVIVGALRQPAPIKDVIQERLFDDHLTILAGNHHPLVGRPDVPRETLRACSWVVPRQKTPSREQFDAFFAEDGPPEGIIESGSFLLMREILANGDHLGCISSTQAQAEISRRLLSKIAVKADWTSRPIGLTYRAGWLPTPAQKLLVDLLRECASVSLL